MADTYTLVIEIDAESHSILASAASRVVVTKQNATGTSTVAWLAWDPCPSTTIVWHETYGLYAASAALTGETALRVTAETHPAIDRAIYPFRGAGFDLPASDEGIPRRHYDVRNESNFAATFGLLQAATINGELIRGPINAAVVPPDFTADFTPPSTLRIWAQRAVNGGTVVTVPQNACVVAYDSGRRTVHVQYDHRSRRFNALKT